MKTMFILDNGHGSVINGVPQTAGKRSPDFGLGVIYEGESNRRIVDKIAFELKKLGIDFHVLVPELEDISLRERVKRVNTLAKRQKSVLISVHSDAFTSENANGWSCYTSRGQTDSDNVASIMYGYAKASGINLREDWSDGDPDKEEDFYILRNTICPAVLVENLFMTNMNDYVALKSEKGRAILADIIVKTIIEINSNGL